jgi:hypothetical protein
MVGILLLCAGFSSAQELRLPDSVAAGEGLKVGTSGSGDATFYLVGNTGAIKRDVELGQEIEIKPEELRRAGRYVAILRAGSDKQVKTLWVRAAKANKVSFLARPSRLPVNRPDGITGVAYVFDAYNNLRLEPTPVKFELSVGNSTRSVVAPSRNGIAWVRTASGDREGATQFVASVEGGDPVRRVVQQTAAEPCNLRFQARRTATAIVVETAPIRDCSGNAVPDGTIVTFIQTDSEGRSTVDARIKRGIATAELPLPKGRAQIGVASGVVMGNELTIGGGM